MKISIGILTTFFKIKGSGLDFILKLKKKCVENTGKLGVGEKCK